MTISSTIASIAYNGAGTVGPFTVPFKFLASADLLVIKTEIASGAAATLTLTTDYTVSGAGDAAGGSLSLVVALPVTHRITIIRDPDPLQPVDYTANDKFPAETHELALDRLTTIVQRTLEVVNRCIRVQEGDTGLAVVPKLSDRAGKYLKFDGAGNITTDAGTSATPSSADVSFLQSGAGAVTRTAESKMRDIISVKDFGAIGDGIVNDAPAFALAAAVAGVKLIYVPRGTWLLNSSPAGNVTWLLDGGATITGAGNLLNGTRLELGGSRGPLSIWRNPSSSAANEGVGIKVNISSNEVGTPGANDYVGISDRVTNDNNLDANLWGGDIVVQSGPATGNHQYRGFEIEMSGDNSAGALATDPYTGIGLRYNAIEIVAIAGSQQLTSAGMVYANNVNPSGWWRHGWAFSRIVDTLFQLRKLGGDLADPFSTAIIDMESLVLNPQVFVRGHNSVDTDLSFKNNVDFNMGLIIDSGLAAGKISRLAFADRGANKWRLEKLANNKFSLHDVVAAVDAMIVATGPLFGFGVDPLFRMDVKGGAGLGVPAQRWEVDGGSGIFVELERDSGGGGTATFGTQANHNLGFKTNDVLRIRLDINGDLDFITPTNGAAAAAGTLANAPTAGDPAYWLRIIIAGVNRYIPCW